MVNWISPPWALFRPAKVIHLPVGGDFILIHLFQYTWNWWIWQYNKKSLLIKHFFCYTTAFLSFFYCTSSFVFCSSSSEFIGIIFPCLVYIVRCNESRAFFLWLLYFIWRHTSLTSIALSQHLYKFGDYY